MLISCLFDQLDHQQIPPEKAYIAEPSLAFQQKLLSSRLEPQLLGTGSHSTQVRAHGECEIIVYVTIIAVFAAK